MNITNYSLIKKAHAAGSFNINIGDEVKARVAVNTDLGSFVSRAISAVIIVAALAAFIYLIYGGIQWIMSGGEKEKIKEARDKITQAIIGLAIVAASWAIIQLISIFFGIEIFGSGAITIPKPY